MDTPPPRAWSEFECAACGSHLAAPAEQIARLVGCPTCGAVTDPPEWDAESAAVGGSSHGATVVLASPTVG